MSRFTTAAKVGLFTTVTLGAGLAIYKFVSKTAGARDGYTVYVLLDDATGIAKHSQVRMAGIPVGHIETIKLEDGKARIDIRVKEEVPVFEDAAVAKTTTSLLGEYHLSIAPGTEGKRQLEDGERIPTIIQPTTTDQILKDVGDIAKDVKKITASLRETIGTDTGRDNIKNTLQNLENVTKNLNETVVENRGSIRSILTNVEGITAKSGPQIDGILGDVKAVTGEVRKLTADAEAGKTPEPGEVRQIITKLNRSASHLENTLRNTESVTGRIERGEGTIGRLTKDEQLINEVEGVVEDVGAFVGGLSRLQTIVGLRTDYQFLSATVKSYVELRLQPREDKYYSIELVNDPRGSTRIEQIDVDTTNPNDPPHYREIRTTTTNSFRFSLQFAQRLGPLTGRFGIKESTGGIGVDLNLFQERFQLQQDLFGFGERITPRWRVSLGYEFIQRLWLLGGVDDLMSPERRDYFVGLQVRFNDEDLKTILPFAPSGGL